MSIVETLLLTLELEPLVDDIAAAVAAVLNDLMARNPNEVPIENIKRDAAIDSISTGEAAPSRTFSSSSSYTRIPALSSTSIALEAGLVVRTRERERALSESPHSDGARQQENERGEDSWSLTQRIKC